MSVGASMDSADDDAAVELEAAVAVAVAVGDE